MRSTRFEARGLGGLASAHAMFLRACTASGLTPSNTQQIAHASLGNQRFPFQDYTNTILFSLFFTSGAELVGGHLAFGMMSSNFVPGSPRSDVRCMTKNPNCQRIGPSKFLNAVAAHDTLNISCGRRGDTAKAVYETRSPTSCDATFLAHAHFRLHQPSQHQYGGVVPFRTHPSLC